MNTRSHLCEALALTAILFLAAYLRWANVAPNPAWYTDEGTHLDIARHLLAGQAQYLALTQPWLLSSRLPLFEGLLALAVRLTGLSMQTLRLLTGTLGVGTVGLLYIVVRRVSHDRILALLSAGLLAIYPPAVLYSRFGFSYNLLAPLVLLSLLSVAEYSLHGSKRWLAVASLTIGLGTLSEIWMFVMLAPFALLVLIRHWRDLGWSLLLALLPFGCYAAFMLATTPSIFLFDVRFILSRLNQLPLDRQIATLGQNLLTLSAQDVWLIAGPMGLLLLKPARWRWITLAFLAIPFVLLARTTALFNLSFYYLIPLLPLVMLGMASLLRYSVLWLSQALRQLARSMNIGDQFTQIGWLTLLLALPIALALLASTADLARQVREGFHTDIDGFLLDPSAAQNVAAFVNQQAKADDCVIASPTLAWLLKTRVADMQMPIAYRGQATPHLPAHIPHERWAFDPSVAHARFIIVDNLWRNWAVSNVPGVSDLVRALERWPVVLRSGEIVVYQNPEE